MRYLKPLSLYDKAKRAGLPYLGVDIGKRRSSFCVGYSSSGVIIPIRLPMDGPIYTIRNNLLDNAKVVKDRILEFDGRMTREGLLLQEGWLFTVVNEQFSSKCAEYPIMIRNMRYIKLLSLYDKAKRSVLPYLGVDIGKRRSSICVGYPSSDVIIPMRLPMDGLIYTIRQNLLDNAASSIEFSTALNTLAQ
ncbi:hypothetical protein Q3G72_002765 [Acer saccharum]|nr:hypothetical protein Q3G72_002765 [Acer saccharum]